MAGRWQQNQQRYKPPMANDQIYEGEEDDNFDTASVASVDVTAYQRRPAYNQLNRFGKNIQYRSHQLTQGGGSYRHNNNPRFQYHRGNKKGYRYPGQTPNKPHRRYNKHQQNNDPNSRHFNLNSQSLIKWEVSQNVIAEVRKYGSYEFYLGNDNEHGIKVVIRYGDKLILMRNDFDDAIWGAFQGNIDDWMEWFHGYVHDSFNNKDIDYFKTKFMPQTTICEIDLNDRRNDKILRRIVHEMALSGWNDGIIYMHQVFGDRIFKLLSKGGNMLIHQAAYALHHDTINVLLKLGAKHDVLSGYGETIDQVAIAGFYELLAKTTIIPLTRCHTAPQLMHQLGFNKDEMQVDEKNDDDEKDQALEMEGVPDVNKRILRETVEKLYNAGAANKNKAKPFDELGINKMVSLSDTNYQDRQYLCSILSGNNNNNNQEMNPINFSLESCYYGTIMDVYYYVCSFYVNAWYGAKDTGNQRWIFTPKIKTDDGVIYGTIHCKQPELLGRILTVIPADNSKRVELREPATYNMPSYHQLFRFEWETKCNENGYNIFCRVISRSKYALMVDFDNVPYSNAALRIRNAVIRCTESFPDAKCLDLFSPFPYTTKSKPKLEAACGRKKYDLGQYKILFQHCKFWKVRFGHFDKIQCYAASVQAIKELFEKYKRLDEEKEIQDDEHKLEHHEVVNNEVLDGGDVNLPKEIFGNIKNEEKNYDEWSCEDVVIWIRNIDGRRYDKYADLLMKNMKEKGVDGSCLCNLEETDLHGFGVVDSKDKHDLLISIKQLIQPKGKTTFGHISDDDGTN